MGLRMKTLKLTLKKEPFEVMKTGEKTAEFRKPSKWILSRLVDKEYKFVEFKNGYKKDSPKFTAEYKGYDVAIHKMQSTYSNGLTVTVEPGDLIIMLGAIHGAEGEGV